MKTHTEITDPIAYIAANVTAAVRRTGRWTDAPAIACLSRRTGMAYDDVAEVVAGVEDGMR